MSIRDEILGNGNHVSTLSSTSTCEPVLKLALFEAKWLKMPKSVLWQGVRGKVCDVVEAYHTCTRTYESSPECF